MHFQWQFAMNILVFVKSVDFTNVSVKYDWFILEQCIVFITIILLNQIQQLFLIWYAIISNHVAEYMVFQGPQVKVRVGEEKQLDISIVLKKLRPLVKSWCTISSLCKIRTTFKIKSYVFTHFPRVKSVYKYDHKLVDGMY